MRPSRLSSDPSLSVSFVSVPRMTTGRWVRNSSLCQKVLVAAMSTAPGLEAGAKTAMDQAVDERESNPRPGRMEGGPVDSMDDSEVEAGPPWAMGFLTVVQAGDGGEGHHIHPGAFLPLDMSGQVSEVSWGVVGLARRGGAKRRLRMQRIMVVDYQEDCASTVGSRIGADEDLTRD